LAISRRKFTLEFRTEAAHRVIGTGRNVRVVACELSIEANTLSKSVRDQRRRMEAIEGTSDEPLSAAERAELLRPRREVSELQKDHDFLKLWRNPDCVEMGTVALCLTEIEQKFSA
jgi:transposase